MKNYGRITLSIVTVWFLFSLTAAALHVFENAVNQIGIAVAVAASVPLLAFGVWYAVSKKFREFVLSLNPQLLTLVQIWRIVGFTFLLLQARDVLPAVFAYSAGYGDMLVGITATLVAWKLADPLQRTPSRRVGFILWQVLGMTDLVMAVGLGTTARLISPEGVSMGAMTVLPLSLIPTFLVPLFFILHVICIAQARRWPAGAYATTRAAQAV